MTKIVLANESDHKRALAPIVTGFVDDPVMRWCWPEPEEYLDNISRFANAYGGKAFSLGTAWADEQGRGTALWLGPGEHPDEESLVSVIASTLNEKKQNDIFAALDQLEAYHPQEPHWLLSFIAVDPAFQGCGIGAKLIKEAISKIDEMGCCVYLESSNPRNISFYERHGFKIVGEVKIGDCPLLIPMLRKPQ